MRIKPTNVLDLPSSAYRNQKPVSYPPYQRGKYYLFISLIADIFASLCALYITKLIIDNTIFSVNMLLLIAVIWGITFSVSVYSTVHQHRFRQELKRTFYAGGLSVLILMAAFWLFSIQQPKVLIPIFFGIDIALSFSWRFAIWIQRKTTDNHKPQRILLVGANELSQQIATLIETSRWSHLHIYGYVDNTPHSHYGNYPIIGRLDNIPSVIKANDITEVIITLSPNQRSQIPALLRDLQTLPVKIRVAPEYINLTLYRTVIEHLGALPLINMRHSALKPHQRLIKRVIDMLVASVILIASTPLLGLIAIAIKLDSRGSVLTKQVRVGENGTLFNMYKFRTIIDATATNDNTLTRVGYLLCQFNLDELPQFINVIKGEMSLVGPRPEHPTRVEAYEPAQHKRFTVPQGITGWWQINGREDDPQHINTDDDLFYIKNYSLWLDFKIMLKTIPSLFHKKDALH